MKKWLIRIAVGFGAIVVGLVAFFFASCFWIAPSEETLTLRIAGATHVVVRSPYAEDPAKVIFVINDPKAIKELMEHLHVSKFVSLTKCVCPGSPALGFYKGELLLAEVRLVHRELLRWDGWTRDVALTDSSLLYLIPLLKGHGLTGKDFE